jgi:CMP-N,N'-diacetyllegionaminic acid synthase
MKPLCVIPARAGSKRLARKNMMLLGGRPLVAWTIEAARKSEIFDRVYVSTEADDIAQAAAQFGADVSVRRPVELAGDEVSNVTVSLHLWEELASRGRTYDAVICLQPSSPLRNSDDIMQAWARFVGSQRRCLGSVTPVDAHCFHWAVKRKADGSYGMFFGNQFMKARQHLPKYYRLNGAIKIATVEALRETGNFFTERFDVYQMPEERSVHVATRMDLALCEALLQCPGTSASI